jgi:hypothetical protein
VAAHAPSLRRYLLLGALGKLLVHVH